MTGSMRFAGITDVGQKRTENEDRFLTSTDEGFCILADGMGGRLFGEVASEMAVDIMTRHIRDDFPKSFRRLAAGEQSAAAINLLDDWMRDVNTQVHRKGQIDERYREMGTTLVCLLRIDRQLVMGHVGDSRCYRLQKGTLTQLTEDHSLVNNQVKSGHLTAEEARESQHKNIITRAIGTSSAVKPEVSLHRLVTGDRFLVCSDGLSDMVPDETIRSVLGGPNSIENIAKRLVDEANKNGGRDNITAIVAEYRD